jgi:hypothetical protein
VRGELSPNSRALCSYGPLGLLVAALASVLGAAELALRAAGHEPLYRVYSKPELFWRHDERLGWWLEPGARGRFVGPRPFPIEFDATIQINSLGLRGPEIGPEAPDELRLLFRGDSAVAGFEVEQPETFTALLEQRLTRELGPPVRVINAGVRGYGTDQSYLWFRERGASLGADLVALVFSANDFEDNLTLHRPRRPFGKPAFPLRGDGTLELVGVPVPRFDPCSEWVLDPDMAPRRIDGPLDRLRCRAHMVLVERSALFAWGSMRLARVPGALRGLQGRAELPGRPLLAAGITWVAAGAGSRSELEGKLASALLRARSAPAGRVSSCSCCRRTRAASTAPPWAPPASPHATFPRAAGWE